MIRKITRLGSTDHGHYQILCTDPKCADVNGRPWQRLYPRRTIEGRTLANRDALDHNKTHHPKDGA